MKQNFKKIFIRLVLGKDTNSPDWGIMVALGLLLLFGLVMLSSAGAAEGFKNFDDSYWHIKHQLLFGVLPGIFLFLFFLRFDYKKLKKLATPFLLVAIVLLVLVFVPGVGSTHSTISKSWLYIFGFSIQPAEIVKLAFLLYLASWLSAKSERRIQDFHQGFLPFMIMLGLVMLLIGLQPDFGTLSIIVVMSVAVFFAGGGRLKHILSVGGLGVAGLFLMIKLSPYRAARFTTFLHPELDPQGVGYHINQALLAVGSGGVLGRGFGHSRQKFAYLPEVTGDSIYAIIGEELGFVISFLVVVAFLYLGLKGFNLAQKTEDAFGRLLSIGIVTWIVFQAFLNIGGIVGILPMTGVPLPFISYGGTSLAMSLAAMGILLNISKTRE